MQNKATWLRSDSGGYAVRIQFIPLNATEHERCSKLLKSFTVQQIMATSEGPLSADLYFMDSTPEEQQAQKQKEVVPVIRFMTVLEMKEALEDSGFAVTEKLAPAGQEQKLASAPALTPAPGQAADTALTDEQKVALSKPDPTDKPA